MSQVATQSKATPTGTANVLALTARARAMVLDARSGEDGAGSLALWVEIAGTGPAGYTYDIYFSDPVDASPDDVVVADEELTVVVPVASVANLQGATLDVSDEGGESGLVMVNPNKPAAPPLPPGLNLDEPGLDSELGKRIAEVLDSHVNPSIASHGGRADLVAVGPASGPSGGGASASDGAGDGGSEGAGGVGSEGAGGAGPEGAGGAGPEGAGGAGPVPSGGVIAYLRLSGGCQGCAMSRATLSQGIEVAIRDAVPEVVGVMDVTDHATGANPYF